MTIKRSAWTIKNPMPIPIKDRVVDRPHSRDSIPPLVNTRFHTNPFI
jgi:hypothetical protein